MDSASVSPQFVFNDSETLIGSYSDPDFSLVFRIFSHLAHVHTLVVVFVEMAGGT